MMLDKFADGYVRNIEIKRSRRVVLNPLAEIVVGMFVTVGIGGGQLMMDVLRNRKGRERQQQ